MHDLVAVFDVGKTHTKLSLVDAAGAGVVHAVQRPNRPVQADGLAQLDLAAIETWLLAALAALPHKSRITAIVPVGHGAACALVDAAGQLLAAPDYEDTAFDETAAAYDVERDPFAHTLSPRLPAGLNLGAQLHFLQTRRPQLWARAQQILLLPQYWAWRLCAVAAAEISSLGVHTDLWRPREHGFSALALRRGWAQRIPALRFAGDALGRLSPQIVAATGLPPDCAVLCGLHDSNASWLSHQPHAPDGGSLTVISSGTWTVAMRGGADVDRLQEERDMLANVDVFGSPLATARFMGGREYEAVAGPQSPAPTEDALRQVIAAGAMALPSFAAAGGPFARHRGCLLACEGLAPGQRAALASLYVALVSDAMLSLLGDSDVVVVDGPLARNPLFPRLVQALRPAARVIASAQASGTTAGALALVRGAGRPAAAAPTAAVEPLQIDGLHAYREAWRQHLG